MGPNPAGITVDQSLLQVPLGETISIVGGDVTITGGSLKAPSGRINIAGVASAGEVIPNTPGQPTDLKVASFSNLGQIDLSQGTLLDTNSNSGGTVVIRGGQLLVVDTGASIEGYKADITRTLPVGGRFDERQREIYEVALAAEHRAISCAGPGVLLGDLHAEAYKVIDEAVAFANESDFPTIEEMYEDVYAIEGEIK